MVQQKNQFEKHRAERYRLELLKVKNKSDCEDLVNIDVYNDGEEAGAWMTCLDEVFVGVKSVKVLGHEVNFMGFGIQNDNSVFAVCKSGKKTAHVSIGSIEWPKLAKVQKIWLSAWNERAGS